MFGILEPFFSLSIIKQQNIQTIIPVLKTYFSNFQKNLLVKINCLNNTLRVIKVHLVYQFKILTCIYGIDYPEKYYRFSLIYELLSIKYNSRLRIKTMVNEISPLDSIEKIYKGASWWESEIWDMLGIYFFQKINTVTRLLTDYGFQGYPLRKDFPLTGFSESKYSFTKNRIVYENVELAQEYRIFDYLSPWEKR